MNRGRYYQYNMIKSGSFFCSFLLTLLTLLLLKIQEEKSLGFKRYLNQQAIILNYLYNYCIYCGFLQIHQGSFDICAPNITYFSEKGQTNESYAITKPQPEVEQAFIWCSQVDFLYKASQKNKLTLQNFVYFSILVKHTTQYIIRRSVWPSVK